MSFYRLSAKVVLGKIKKKNKYIYLIYDLNINPEGNWFSSLLCFNQMLISLLSIFIIGIFMLLNLNALTTLKNVYLYILNLFDLSLNPVSSLILDNGDNEDYLSSSIVQASKATPEELAEKTRERDVLGGVIEKEKTKRAEIDAKQSEAGDNSDSEMEQKYTTKLEEKDELISILEKTKNLIDEWFNS